MLRIALLSGSSILWHTMMVTSPALSIKASTSVQWKTGFAVVLETEETGPSRPGTREGGALAFPDWCCLCDDLWPGWPAPDLWPSWPASDLGRRLVTRWPGGRGRRLKGDMRPVWGSEDERLAAARRSSWARYTGSDSRLKQKIFIESVYFRNKRTIRTIESWGLSLRDLQYYLNGFKMLGTGGACEMGRMPGLGW